MPDYFEAGIFANRPAWHGLGVVFDEQEEGKYLDSATALELGGLDWDVELVPVEWQGAETGYNLVVRETDDKVLGCVGSKYQPIQNREGFAMLDQLIDAGELMIESAISLKEGRNVVVVARRPDEILIAGEEHIPYIMCILYHDGTGAVKFMTDPTRVVCANTMAFALSSARRHKRMYSVRHTANAKIRLAEARTALAISYKYTEEFMVIGEELVQVKFSDSEFDKFLKDLVEDEKDDGEIKKRNNKALREGVRAVWKESDNLNNIRRTKWGALNAVVEYTQHHREYVDPERRFASVLDRNPVDQKAFDLLVSAN